MAIESYMKTSPRSRFWIRETGKASINGHMPVEKSRNKREGRPRPPAPILSIPPMPDSSGVSSHHPATISHPLFVNCHAGELARLGASHTCAWLVSRRSLFPSRTTKHNEGDGVWRGSRKTEPPPRDKKKPLSNGRIAAVCRGLPRPWHKAPLCRPLPVWGTQRKRGPLSQPRNPARNRPLRRRCCSGCSGDEWKVRRKTDSTAVQEQGKGGPGSLSRPPKTPTPTYFPSVRP